MRISFFGNFGAGNLGNECTLQAIIEQLLEYEPGAQFLCFCTNPEDVRSRHRIAALPAAVTRRGSWGQGRLSRILRILFRWIPLELAQWVRTIGPMSRSDMFIIAGTGIVNDYLTGPLGWPYDFFRLSVLAGLLRTKVVFLSVGVGPITHPLSRWFIKRSLGIASFRSYRDQASRDYLEGIGFDTRRDFVYPDVVFGLSQGNLPARATAGGERRTIGLGLKDYYGSPDSPDAQAHRDYLRTIAEFIAWLHAHGYGVRLLIGDMQYDNPVISEFVPLLGQLGIATQAPLLMVEPALTVADVLRQIADTEAVISARYHNLVMALIQGKPVMALSDHAKLDSLVSDFGLARYRIPLANLKTETLIDRFRQLESELERLKPYVRAGVDRYRQELDRQYASLLGQRRIEAPPARVVP
jgi:polysaccharide pyruvyl transferase WcaK-like protein